ncbi:Monothiol glutaredoxin-5 [Diplonema papillatum]|nr:Monothiol glutaredoxin-5 [Diplonema papillatum]
MLRATARAAVARALVAAPVQKLSVGGSSSSSRSSMRLPALGAVGGQSRWCSGYTEADKKEIMDEMRNDIKQNKVVLFIKGEPEAPRCGFSGRTVDLLSQYGVAYTAYNVLAHPAVREGIKEISGWPTIPQLFVNGEFVGGCDLLVEMHGSGDLADLFKNAGVPFRCPKTGVTHGEVQGYEQS